MASDATPERMTKEWLRQAVEAPGLIRPSGVQIMAREILRLRAEVACKGCGGTVGHHLAPDQGGCPGRFVIDGMPMVPAAHVDAARAEVERLNHLADAGKMAMSNVFSALDETGRTRGSAVERIRDLACERDAAIRDRNEFAAAQVVKFVRDVLDDDHCLYKLPTWTECASFRAAELRKASVGATATKWNRIDGQCDPGPHKEAVDRIMDLAEDERGSDEYEGEHHLEWRKEMRALILAELRKAAPSATIPSAAPDSLPSPETRSPSGRMCGSREHQAPQPTPAAPASARLDPREAQRRSFAFGNVAMSNGMSREAFDKVADATPPADLHQAPADADGRYRETINRVFDAMQARMDADAAKLAEWPALVARLAAAEKAKAELRATLDELLTRIDQMPNPHSDPMRHYYNQMQVWKSEAAERAGGAS